MGIYRPLVERGQSVNRTSSVEPSDRLITPATIVSGTRPVLAGIAAKKLITGERWVTPYVATMAATDMEGMLARWIDKQWPNSGLGTSIPGVPADVGADTAALLIVAGATLKAPNVPLPAKAGVAAILGQEGTKAAWFALKSRDYTAATVSVENPKGLKLEFPIDFDGKEAMVEKALGIVAASAISDFENPLIRVALTGLAVGHAVPGTRRGEHTRRGYDHQFEDIMGALAEQNQFV